MCKSIWLPIRGGSFIFSVYRILLRQKSLLALRVGSMVHRDWHSAWRDHGTEFCCRGGAVPGDGGFGVEQKSVAPRGPGGTLDTPHPGVCICAPTQCCKSEKAKSRPVGKLKPTINFITFCVCVERLV